MNKRISIKGFTLIELITVISILVILSSMFVPNIIDQRRMARIEAANDGAYRVYIAAQNYLNTLQKKGENAYEYFGKGGSCGGGTVNGLGYMSVNAGVLSLSNPDRKDFSHAFHNADENNSGNTHMAAADRPIERKQYEAFKGIVGYEMGKKVQVCKMNKLLNQGIPEPINTPTESDPRADEVFVAYSDTEPNKAGSNAVFVCTEMNQAHESFLIEVFPATYTVRAVYYTTYRTNHTPYSGYLTDDIFSRVYGKHSDLVRDNGVQSNYLGPYGFSRVNKGEGDKFSQEYVSRKSGYTRMGYSYAPAYVGQYPIPPN